MRSSSSTLSNRERKRSAQNPFFAILAILLNGSKRERESGERRDKTLGFVGIGRLERFVVSVLPLFCWNDVMIDNMDINM
jgi:hypothetical protein